MKIREYIFRLMLICLLVVPCNWARGDESPDLRLVQTGRGVYSLQGSGYKEVAGTDVTIRYDAALLGNPVIEFGELATGSTTSNTSQAGQLLIISVDINGNANSTGTGTFATLTFDIIGKPAGSISAHVNLIDINGALLATRESAAPVVYKEPGTDTGRETGKDSPAGMEKPTESGPDPGASSDIPGGNRDESVVQEMKEEGPLNQ